MGQEGSSGDWAAELSLETVGRVSDRRGRRRPRRLTRSGRRAQLLHSALTAFARDGVLETTMDSIAATAGVSKPLVYQHFRNKREALLALVDDHSGELLAAIGGADEGPGASLEELVRRYLQFAQGHAVPFQLLFQAVDGTDAPATARIDRTRAVVGDRLLAAALGPEAEALAAIPAWAGPALCALVEGVARRLPADA
ncbi:MAG TPA: TetR/AcrR family transcriptional regulator, partial [Candidatus Dormibacteraeota bacterium]|nr:TetR/AcrR family transcriptional regulator [Candidatus Dormibacteraeota bacterium]